MSGDRLADKIQGPFERLLAAAEYDDEPVTAEEVRDIEVTREWFRHNEGTPFEQVVAELGLTMEDLTNFRKNS